MLRILGAVMIALSLSATAADDLDFNTAIEDAQRMLERGEIHKTILDVEKKMGSVHLDNAPMIKNMTDVKPRLIDEIPFDRIEKERLAVTDQLEKERISVLVFVSSSMPENTIKQIMISTEKIGGTILLQGFVDGDFAKTREWLLNIMGSDAESSLNPNLAIDPTAFDRFDISTVPVYMAISGGLAACTNDQCPIPEHILLSGNVEVPWALRKLGDGKPEWQSQLYNLAVTAESF